MNQFLEGKVKVPAAGPADAELVFIGEAPAKNELFEMKPFVGSAGQYLDKLFNLAAIIREEVRLENLSEVRAPGDKIERMSYEEIKYWESDLIARINALPDPKILVPMGAYALRALTDKKSITHFRGSPLQPKNAIKHDCIVIPTLHPSNLHYNYKVWILIVADLIKIKTIADKNFEFEFPTWDFIIKPDFDKVMEILDFLETNPSEYYTIDVETPQNVLSAIGIAWNRREAISIPLYNGDRSNYWSLEQEAFIWRRMSQVLPELDMANQNVLFDWRILAEHGLHLKMPTWDPMLMHHCLYSEMPHKLDDITSIYTNLEFYKKDEKEEKGSSLRPGGEKNHWTYNCFDCIAPHWAIDELRKELIEEKMMDVYIDLYAEIIPVIFKMNMRGVPVDVPLLADVRKERQQLLRDYSQNITDETGYEIDVDHLLAPGGSKRLKENMDKININSPKQVSFLLYDRMSMDRYKGEATAKKTLEKLAYKYQTDVPKWIIDIRSARKELGLFSDENVVDGRILTEYSPRAETGRFKSRKAFGKGGMNLQNVKTGLQRRFFIAEPNMSPKQVLLGADQSQAEARLCGWWSQDDAMIALFDSGVSIHIQNGLNVFGIELTKDDPLYTIAKSLIFGGNYGIGPWKFARMANIPFSDAKSHIATYHATYPGVHAIFHTYVQREINKSRMLYNPFGRREVFIGRKDDDTYRKGYAFLPQSTSSDINKKAMKEIDKHYTVFLELHDGLVLSVPEPEVMNAAHALKEAYDIPFKIWDETHTLPVEISVGPNWDEMEVIDI